MKKNLAVISIASTSLMLTSCIFDPKNVKPPKLKAPTHWTEKNKKLNTEKCDLKCIAWWEQFNDPVLNELIDKGLQQNNDLQVAVSNIEAAQGELKKIKWSWAPGLDSFLGYSSFPYLGYPGVIAAILPVYTINLLNQIKLQDKARSQVFITQHMRDTVKLAVIAQITGSYFTYLGQVEELALLKRIEQDLSKRVNIHRIRYKTGLSSEIELSELKAELDLIKAQEMITQKNIVFSQNTLRYLLNESPAPFSFNREFADLNPHQVITGGMPTSILMNRPDMKQAIQELKVANAEIGIAVSNFLPTLSLWMARGDIGTVPNGKKLGQPVYFDQALFESPLIHASSFGEWAKQRGSAQVAYYKFIDTFRKVLKDVDNDIAAHAFYSNRLDETAQAYRHQDYAYKLQKSLYEQGIISYQKLMGHKTTRDEIRVQVNKAKTEQLLTVVSLYQNLAVGYGCSPPNLTRADYDSSWILAKLPFNIPFYNRKSDNLEMPIIFTE